LGPEPYRDDHWADHGYSVANDRLHLHVVMDSNAEDKAPCMPTFFCKNFPLFLLTVAALLFELRHRDRRGLQL
jgi:hypothetical protein